MKQSGTLRNEDLRDQAPTGGTAGRAGLAGFASRAGQRGHTRYGSHSGQAGQGGHDSHQRYTSHGNHASQGSHMSQGSQDGHGLGPASLLPVMRPRQQIHGGLFIVTLIMICFGLVMLFSASMSDGYASYDGDTMHYVIRQSVITVIGLVLALFIAVVIPVRFFKQIWMALLLYGLTSGLLVYVKFKGFVMNGARRWVNIGPTDFQPSELAKIAVVFCLAGYYSWLVRRRKAGHFQFRSAVRRFLADGWLDLLLPLFLVAPWLVLILMQPHVSGFLIISFLILVCMTVANLPWRSWLSGLLQGLVLLVIIAMLVLALVPVLYPDVTIQSIIQTNFEHAQSRIDSFLHPDMVDPDETYQIRQSMIAIGSGGLSGLGLGSGRQKYNYLPEAHNDYVFAIIGEELGFGGTSIVLLLFVLFVTMGAGIALKAGSVHATILASGYTMLIGIQSLLNIGVATRTLPATGISLPFFSYGGTSNLFFLLAIGFILAVSRSGQRQLTGLAPYGTGQPVAHRSHEPMDEQNYPATDNQPGMAAASPEKAYAGLDQTGRHSRYREVT